MVAWQLRAAQSLLFATAVCHEVAVVTPSQFDSVVELFLPLWKLGRKTASAGGQVKSSRLRNPSHQARRICREGEAGDIMQVGGVAACTTEIHLGRPQSKDLTCYSSHVAATACNSTHRSTRMFGTLPSLIHLPPSSSTAEYKLARLLTSLCRPWRMVSASRSARGGSPTEILLLGCREPHDPSRHVDPTDKGCWSADCATSGLGCKRQVCAADEIGLVKNDSSKMAAQPKDGVNGKATRAKPISVLDAWPD